MQCGCAAIKGEILIAAAEAWVLVQLGSWQQSVGPLPCHTALVIKVFCGVVIAPQSHNAAGL